MEDLIFSKFSIFICYIFDILHFVILKTLKSFPKRKNSSKIIAFLLAHIHNNP